VSTADLVGARWHKSSFSGNGSDGDCVQVALGGSAALRDSKNPTGPVLVLQADGWAAFLAVAKREVP
jgi:hypothetical protein